MGAPAAGGERPWNARFGPVLVLLCLAAAAARAAILAEQLDENPFARVPFSDGELYWKMAGDLASGAGLGGEPFLVAPLYPALLGLLRACGGGLAAVYGVQAALHLATAALVAAAARARFGPREGLAAAALFLLLAEPALYTARVLSATLQLFLAAWFGWEWARLAATATHPRPFRKRWSRPATPSGDGRGAGVPKRGTGRAPEDALAGSPACGLRQAARAGLSLGVFALSFPAALALLPLLAIWLARRSGLARAAWAAAAAGGAIAPAALHNLLASGELVPIAAHSGITLAHGNGPASIGIYTPLAGVGRSLQEQHRDAARLFEREVGRAGSWSEVDAHFRRRVLAWWRAHPRDAAALLARKLHWTLSSRGYDNVATFALEREHGLGRRAALAPLELPWLLGVGLLGLALAARERRGVAPELAPLLLPVLVCVVFHYSGRYRLVAAPALCALAGLGLVRWRALPWPRAATLGVALLPLPLLASDAAVGFGALEFMRDEFARTLARQHARAGRLREAEGDALAAERHYRRALAARPGEPLASRALYNLEVARGDFAGGRATLEALARAEPEDAEAHLALAWLLAGVADPALRDGDAALAHVREAERLLGADHPETLLARALAEAERGRFAEASEATRRGEERARARGDDALARSLASLREALRAERGVETPPRPLRIAGR